MKLIWIDINLLGRRSQCRAPTPTPVSVRYAGTCRPPKRLSPLFVKPCIDSCCKSFFSSTRELSFLSFSSPVCCVIFLPPLRVCPFFPLWRWFFPSPLLSLCEEFFVLRSGVCHTGCETTHFTCATCSALCSWVAECVCTRVFVCLSCCVALPCTSPSCVATHGVRRARRGASVVVLLPFPEVFYVPRRNCDG